jgi:hypothetical protein
MFNIDNVIKIRGVNAFMVFDETLCVNLFENHIPAVSINPSCFMLYPTLLHPSRTNAPNAP